MRAASLPTLSTTGPRSTHRRGDRQGGIHPGRDVGLAIDAAASEFYADGAYNFEGSRRHRGDDAIYAEWLNAYPSFRSKTRLLRRTGPAGSS